MSKWLLARINEGRNVNGTSVLDPEVFEETYATSLFSWGGPTFFRPRDPATYHVGANVGLGYMNGYYRGKYPNKLHLSL